MSHKLYISTAVLTSVICTLAFVLLSGCTYSINFAHSEGHASELINDADSAQPNVTPSFVMPPSPLRV